MFRAGDSVQKGHTRATKLMLQKKTWKKEQQQQSTGKIYDLLKQDLNYVIYT